MRNVYDIFFESVKAYRGLLGEAAAATKTIFGFSPVGDLLIDVLRTEKRLDEAWAAAARLER